MTASHAGQQRGAACGEPPAVHMQWCNLLFLHWRVDPQHIRPLLPVDLELDLYDNAAWVALVPFQMRAARFRGVPPLPGLGEFYECNVRTYVRYRGHPGVWFFSLDAQTLFPVLGGRWIWNLNYIYSRFSVIADAAEDRHDYRLRRRPGPWPAGSTSVRWTVGPPRPAAQPGELAYFLTERYWLFTVKRRRVRGGRIQHQLWPLHDATLEHLDDALISAAGINVDNAPLAWASRRLDVVGWKLCDPPSR